MSSGALYMASCLSTLLSSSWWSNNGWIRQLCILAHVVNSLPLHCYI